jgi:HK97 family phage portal protein
VGKNNVHKIDEKLESLQTKSLDSAFLNENVSEGGMFDSEIRAFIDNSTLKSLFFNEDWVFIILDLLASEISNVDMRVFTETVTDGNRSVVVNESHPLNALIQNPNPWQDYSTWMYLHVIELCLMGNAIQWYAEANNQMIILPAENVCPDVDEKGRLKQYLVHSQVGKSGFDGMDKFPVDQILHQRRPNPVSVHWGLSPFVPNRKSILFNKYSQDYLNSFYLRQATGSLALKLDKQVSEESALRLMRSFEMSYTGRRNTRRTMLLPKGVDVKELSQSITDQNLIEVINQNQEKIINILRIPKHALSLAEAGSLGSEEHKMALRFMWTSAIVPIMKKIAGTFTAFFKDQLGDNNKFLFDMSQIEILREDALRTADLAIKQLEFKTLNEVRNDLFDLPPLEGGDETPTLSSKELEIDDFSTDEMEDYETANDGIIETKEQTGVDYAKRLMNKFDSWINVSQKALNQEVDKSQTKMLEVALDLYGQMVKASVRAFKKTFKDKKSAKYKQKASSGSKRKFRQELDKEFAALEGKYLEDYMDSLTPTMEAGYDTNLDLIQNEDDKTEVGLLGSKNKARRKRNLESRAMDSYSFITDSTEQQVIDIIDEGIAEGKTTEVIATGIVAGFAVLGNRGPTVAKTESLTAVSIGKKSVMDDATEVIPNLMKVWINLGDEKVRGRPEPGGIYPNSKADHWSLQGEVRRAKNRNGDDVKFSNGLRYPRDVNSTKAEEVVNCRCDLIMVAQEDLDDLNIPRP